MVSIFKKLSFSKSDFGKTNFITGIRAYAALAVLLIHSGGGGLRDLGEAGNKVVDFGKYGVIVFFVISAYTIINSIEHHAEFSYLKYLLRRLFRILPVYIAVITVLVIMQNRALIESYKELILHFSFLNLFFVGHRDVVTTVAWTIPIEVFFYLLIPVVIYFKKNRYISLLNLTLIALCISILSVRHVFLPYFGDVEHGMILHYSVERYAFAYMSGILLFYLQKHFINLKASNLSLLLLLVLLFFYILFSHNDGFSNEIFVTLWTVALIALCMSGNFLSKLLFENRVVQYFGLISYSLYLVHFPIIVQLESRLSGFPLLIISILVATVVSSFTYLLIEKPFIALGKKLTE